jgi:hypothetical protein
MSIESVLEAIADTFIAKLNAAETEIITKRYTELVSTSVQLDKDTVKGFLQYKASDINGIGGLMLDYLSTALPQDKVGTVLFILRSLGTSAGN